MEHDAAIAVGTVAALADRLDTLIALLRKGEEWGGSGDLTKVGWDPATPAGGDKASAEYAYEGTFASVGIFNLSAGAVRVSLTPNGALVAGRELFTLSARGFIVLPYRGTTVSLAGDAAGKALIVPCEVPQPLNAGTF